MIRFMPDTWQDAVLRPLAMADPNGGIYIEIVAPDFRFVFALGLAIALLASMRTKTQEGKGLRPVLLLFGLVFLSFAPWLATTGNGRYFMTYLILIGPLCIGLVSKLSCTRSMKASVAMLVLSLQGFALYQNNPWKPFDSWESIPWHDAPYFSIDIDPQSLKSDATYISVSSMSLSLVAPQFPVNSRWVNLSVFNGSDVSQNSTTYEPVRKILQTSQSLKLFQRSAPRAMATGSDQPNQAAIKDINGYLQPHRLALKEPTDCKLLQSKSLLFQTLMATDDSAEEKARISDKAGFWICSLQYPVALPPTAVLSDGARKAKAVFEKMEALCPRFFAPGQTLVGNHSAGHARAYSSSDSSLIVTRDGDLYVQNMRALNPERIGPVDEVLKLGYKIDCTKFKGRSGLPWEREI